MNVTISSKAENDYLLIESSGGIFNLEQYKSLTKRYIDEIAKYGIKKILVDESKIQWAERIQL